MGKFHRSLGAAVIVWGSWLSLAAGADTVDRYSTPRSEIGTVLSVSRDAVTVRRALPGQEAMEVTVPANDVRAIQFDGEPPVLNLARQAELRGELEFALERYREAAATRPAPTALIRTDIEFFLARTSARQALADPVKLPEAAQLLEQFRQKHPSSYHYYPLHEWLGRIYIEEKKYDLARSAFEVLAQAPWREYRWRAQLGEADIHRHQQNYAAAMQTLESILTATPQNPLEQRIHQDALLLQAECLSKQGSANEAEALLREIIDSAAPEDSALLARAYNLLGDCLYADRAPAEQDVQAALLAYLHVDVLPHLATQKQEHAKALYWLSKLWNEVGKADRAEDARARLQQQYPNSPLAQN